MKNKKIAILIILTMMAFISVFYGITSSPRNRGGMPPGRPSFLEGQYASVERLKDIAPLERKAKRSAYNDWRRNPFLPKVAAARTELGLSGIMWDDKNPLAIINNEVVGKGGKVAGYTVAEIKKDSVILDNGTKKLELKLEQ